MPGLSETLKLVVTGDTSGAVRELKQLNAQTTQSLSNTTQKTTGLSKALGSINTGTLAAGFAVAGAAALKFGADAVQAAADDQVAHTRLQQAVENTGDSYAVFGDKIKGTEQTLMRLGFADDETAASLSRLVGATGDTNEALGQMGLAADIARGRNISLGEATAILSKVAIGNVGALRRLGIETKDATGATISQEEAVKRLTKLYGGQAAAYADTYAGKVEALKVQFGEIQEQIGYALIPAVEDFANALQSSLDVYGAVATGVGKLGINFGDLTKEVLKGTPVLGSVIQAFDLLGQATGNNEDSAKSATNVQKELTEAQGEYADFLAKGTENTNAGKEARDRLNAAQADSKTITEGLADATNEEADATKEAGQSIDQYRKALADANDEQKTFLDGVLGISANADTLEEDFIKIKQGIDEYGKATTDGETSTDDLRLSQLDLQGQIRDLAKDAGDAAFEQAKLAGKSDAGRIAADAQKEALYKLALTLAPNSPLRAYVNGLITDLDKANQTHAKPTLDLTVSINGQKVPIAAVNSAIGAGGQFIRPQGRMAGGPVNAGQIYMVGESGPELFMSTSGGSIVPNGVGVSSGGGATYNLTVVSIDPTKAGDAVVAALREYERSNGRIPIKVA